MIFSNPWEETLWVSTGADFIEVSRLKSGFFMNPKKAYLL